MARPHLIDLSHPIEHGMITYKGLPAPVIGDYLSREDSRAHYANGTEFHIGKITMVANTGTYIDSPFHRYPDGADIAALELESIADLDAVVIRVNDRTTRQIARSEVAEEEVTGKAVLLYSGWADHWGSDRYFGGHPFLATAAALFLRDAGALLVGIDSLNIDDTRGGERPVHSLLLGAGIPIVEHLRGLEQLPRGGFRFSAVPAGIRGLGSFPVRAYASLPRPLGEIS
jgi:kynurenine formamidase